jgi:hypothetical protein
LSLFENLTRLIVRNSHEFEECLKQLFDHDPSRKISPPFLAGSILTELLDWS